MSGSINFSLSSFLQKGAGPPGFVIELELDSYQLVPGGLLITRTLEDPSVRIVSSSESLLK